MFSKLIYYTLLLATKPDIPTVQDRLIEIDISRCCKNDYIGQ